MSEIDVVMYEVIADYPESIFCIGDKIKVYHNTGVAYLVDGKDAEDVRDYPQIFKQVDSNQLQSGSEKI